MSSQTQQSSEFLQEIFQPAPKDTSTLLSQVEDDMRRAGFDPSDPVQVEEFWKMKGVGI